MSLLLVHLQSRTQSVSMSFATDSNGTESIDGNSKYVDPSPTSLYASGKISSVSLKSSKVTFPKPEDLVVKREIAWRPVADPCMVGGVEGSLVWLQFGCIVRHHQECLPLRSSKTISKSKGSRSGRLTGAGSLSLSLVPLNNRWRRSITG